MLEGKRFKLTIIYIFLVVDFLVASADKVFECELQITRNGRKLICGSVWAGERLECLYPSKLFAPERQKTLDH